VIVSCLSRGWEEVTLKYSAIDYPKKLKAVQDCRDRLIQDHMLRISLGIFVFVPESARR
jgi:hypothetical protein